MPRTAATAAAARLAHRDERRHVHFGISHIRRSIARDPDLQPALVAAAQAAKLVSLSGLSPILIEALTIMSARSLAPAELSQAAADDPRLDGHDAAQPAAAGSPQPDLTRRPRNSCPTCTRRT